ncbi:hypothetical protein PENTCL1PPCAC_10944 [Pristionchus entomophagus]|uniref:Sex-determining region Y protein n=1 Tax=Pristionchus entomophagus TaxID=358040 RepID=A0AAV5T578_9BILA|nr:hypothetical protein PENTCL1PPCAC_10944 [Pristionchus entomophagus]
MKASGWEEHKIERVPNPFFKEMPLTADKISNDDDDGKPVPSSPSSPFVNGFILWARDERRKLSQEDPMMSKSEISEQLGERWKKLSVDKKMTFVDEARRMRASNAEVSCQASSQEEKAPTADDSSLDSQAEVEDQVITAKQLDDIVASGRHKSSVPIPSDAPHDTPLQNTAKIPRPTNAFMLWSNSLGAN